MLLSTLCYKSNSTLDETTVKLHVHVHVKTDVVLLNSRSQENILMLAKII